MTPPLRPPTLEESGLLRSRSHRSRHHVLIDIPPTVFSCQVNQSFSTTDFIVEVDYDSVSFGSFEDVLPGMTCYVGSSPGSWDLGIVRIRKSPTESRLYVGEHADVFWGNDVFLTVVDEMFFWAKFPRTFSTGEIRMDWDVEYGSQHSICAPVPVLGSDVVRIWDGTPLEIHFDGSNSWSPSSGSLEFLWSCSGVTIDDPTSATPVFTVSSPGRYRVQCIVSRGTADWVGYRYMYIYPKSQFFALPYVVSDSPEGDRESGGYKWSLQVSGSIQTVSKYREGMKAFLVAEDWYGSTKISLGPQQDRENIVVQGWISGIEPIASDRRSGGGVEIEILGAHHWLGSIESFIDGIESQPGTPSDWTTFAGLTLDKCIWHLCTWRSTISSIIDVYPSGISRGVKELQAGAGNLWDQLVQNAEPFVATCCTDRYSRLFVFQEQQTVPVANRSSIPEIWSIDRGDWEPPLNLERRALPTVSMINLSGVRHLDGSSPKAIFSLAAGHSFKRLGERRSFQYLALESQSQANGLAGLLLGWFNVQWEIEVTLGWNFRLIDIAPASYLEVYIRSDDTPRQIEMTPRMIPREVRFEISSGYIHTEISGEIESFPENAVDGDIPSDPDFDSSFSPFPPMPAFPPLPLPILPPETPSTQSPTHVAFLSTNYGIGFTEVFDKSGAEVIWELMNEGLTEEDLAETYGLQVTPGGVLYCLVGGNKSIGFERVYASPGFRAPWTQIFSIEEYPEEGSRICSIGVNPLELDEIAVWGGRPWSWPIDGNIGTGIIGIGNRSGISLVESSAQPWHRGAAGQIIFTGDHWSVLTVRGTGILGNFSSPTLRKFSKTGAHISSTLVGVHVGQLGNPGYGISVGNTNRIIRWDDSGVGGFGDIEGVSQTWRTTLDLAGRQGMSFGPSGQFGMGYSGGYVPYRTLDGGETWEALSVLIPIGNSVYENCRDDHRVIFGGGTNLNLTLSRGESYEVKMGNLPQIAPLINIVNLRYLR